MSSWYGMYVKLDLNWVQHNILIILEKGTERGYKYFTYTPYLTIEHQLAVNEALEKLSQKSEDDQRVIVVTKEFHAILHTMNDEKKLGVLLTAFSYKKLKKFKDANENLDIQKYTKEFLQLIEDFRIMRLSIEQDYY